MTEEVKKPRRRRKAAVETVETKAAVPAALVFSVDTTVVHGASRTIFFRAGTPREVNAVDRAACISAGAKEV